MGMYLLERARDLGTAFRSGHVEAVDTRSHRLHGLTLAGGEKVDCDYL